jgi:PKD repeat protein
MNAQISQGGWPVSYLQNNLKSSGVIVNLELDGIQPIVLSKQDDLLGITNRYGVVQDVSLDLKTGSKQTVDDGDIWLYHIESDSSKSIKLFFDSLIIPTGAQLFVYNSDYSIVYGAFTNENVDSNGVFTVADFPESELTIEYFEPADAEFSGSLILGQVGLAYRDLNQLFSSEDDDGLIDVNCDDGIEWQYQKHAVCKYTFTEEQYSYTCTGALINNNKEDGTPYFLTAFHCISSSTSTSSIVAYFNYETSGCGLDQESTKTLSGASLITKGEDSDFTLLKLKDTPPASYQPYYAGWDLTDSADQTVGIHHPNGLMKKIVFDYDSPTTYDEIVFWDDDESTPANTHWLVEFDYGVTESGSSGSPLFNQDKRIIGQLHGGGDEYDLYGKLNYSWSNNERLYSKLQTYLDSDDELTFIDGYFPSDNWPEAVFKTDYQYVCVGASIPFIDYSVFDVSSWHWVFSPSTVTFADSTSEYSQNPIVEFDEAGTYDVKLVVENSVGKDSLTYSSLITAGATISTAMDFYPESGSCLCSVDSIEASATGAFQYEWKLDSLSDIYYNISISDSSNMVINTDDEYVPDSTFYITGVLIGQQGVCFDTSAFSIELVKPVNDNIENAISISSGVNGPYSNECASVEENEPEPPVNDCVSQSDWCDEYGTGEDVVENSMWFYLIGPESGSVTIEANNMDGQIALYEADSYQSILNGDYNLLAANDDVSLLDYISRIENVSVNPGEKYWLQFDGSAGGAVGEFYIELSVLTDVNLTSVSDCDELLVYPQPASNYLIVENGGLNAGDKVSVKINSYTGALVYSDVLIAESNKLVVQLGSDLCDGVYVLSLTSEYLMMGTSFVKRKE